MTATITAFPQEPALACVCELFTEAASEHTYLCSIPESHELDIAAQEIYQYFWSAAEAMEAHSPYTGALLKAAILEVDWCAVAKEALDVLGRDYPYVPREQREGGFLVRYSAPVVQEVRLAFAKGCTALDPKQVEFLFPLFEAALKAAS